MLAPGFVQALVTYAEVKGAAGLQELRDEFQSLFDKIKAGEGSAIINAAGNGKTFGYQVNATVEELFTAYGEALRQVDDDVTGSVTQTYADFTELQR